MDVIWKHAVPDVLDLREGAQVLHAGRDPEGHLCIWEVHQEGAPVGPPRTFEVIATGQPFPGGQHLGTVNSGPFVWHVFETTTPAT